MSDENLKYDQLLAIVKDLQRRIEALEQRPVYIPIYQPVCPQPYQPQLGYPGATPTWFQTSPNGH